MDEISAPNDDDSAPAPSGSAAKGPVRAYSPAVLADRQPKVTDLLPVRPLMAALLVLAALTGVAAIETIHIHIAASPLAAHAAKLAAFDVSARGSLAAWYSSALFASGALLSLAVFGIRAHRVDDYRGRYRIWPWIAAALLFLSLDAATGLHDAIGFALHATLGPRLLGSDLATASSLAWTMLYGALFGALWLRVAIEVWSSLAGLAMLACAGLLYLTTGLLHLGVLPIHDSLLASVASSSAAMLAHLALVTCIGLYARHVYLDATGRLKVHLNPEKKAAKSKSRTKLKILKSEQTVPAESKSSSGSSTSAPATSARPSESIRFGASADQSSRSSAAVTKASLSSPMQDDEDDDSDEDTGDERLSKSERRRLKKLSRRDPNQRRAA